MGRTMKVSSLNAYTCMTLSSRKTTGSPRPLTLFTAKNVRRVVVVPQGARHVLAQVTQSPRPVPDAAVEHQHRLRLQPFIGKLIKSFPLFMPCRVIHQFA